MTHHLGIDPGNARDIVLIFPEGIAEYFIHAFRRQMPDREIHVWPSPASWETIGYAMALMPPDGALGSFPNLSCIMPVGAGIEHLFSDSTLPDSVPIVRCIQPDLIQRMVEYVTLYVLEHHRSARYYRESQTCREWQPLFPPAATRRTVGMLGMGKIGQACANMLKCLGFQIRCWSRTAKSIAGVHSYTGSSQLKEFLSGCDILVCLLPQTEATTDLINRNFLSLLTPGACFINAGRGAVVVEDDLLYALDTGQIAEATLDVFSAEPLPADSPLWAHPKVTITPHAASAVDPEAAASFMKFIIEAIERKDSISNFVVDRNLGY